MHVSTDSWNNIADQMGQLRYVKQWKPVFEEVTIYLMMVSCR